MEGGSLQPGSPAVSDDAVGRAGTRHRNAQRRSMRVVLLGSTHFSVACFNTLLRLGVDIAGVVTTPADIRISYAPSPIRLVHHADLAEAAAAVACPVVCVAGKMSEYAAVIRSLRPDFLL